MKHFQLNICGAFQVILKSIKFHLHFIVTARIRKMGEGNIFSLFTLAGGEGGTPSQIWGVPHLRSEVGGGYLARSGLGGVPHPMSGVGGYPISGPGGTPSPEEDPMSGRGYPMSGRGYPMSGGGYPISRPSPHCTEQHSEHLLRGGRCASCVHVGGISCCISLCWGWGQMNIDK